MVIVELSGWNTREFSYSRHEFPEVTYKGKKYNVNGNRAPAGENGRCVLAHFVDTDDLRVVPLAHIRGEWGPSMFIRSGHLEAKRVSAAAEEIRKRSQRTTKVELVRAFNLLGLRPDSFRGNDSKVEFDLHEAQELLDLMAAFAEDISI